LLLSDAKNTKASALLRYSRTVKLYEFAQEMNTYIMHSLATRYCKREISQIFVTAQNNDWGKATWVEETQTVAGMGL